MQLENNIIKRDGRKKGKIALKIHITFPTKSVTIMYHHKNQVPKQRAKTKCYWLPACINILKKNTKSLQKYLNILSLYNPPHFVYKRLK